MRTDHGGVEQAALGAKLMVEREARAFNHEKSKDASG